MILDDVSVNAEPRLLPAEQSLPKPRFLLRYRICIDAVTCPTAPWPEGTSTAHRVDVPASRPP